MEPIQFRYLNPLIASPHKMIKHTETIVVNLTNLRRIRKIKFR